LSTAAAARDRRKFFMAFFHVLSFFFQIFGVKPILSLIYYIYAESKNEFRAKKKFRLSRGVAVVADIAVGFWTKFEAQVAQPYKVLES
jgi:hypothetical protein